MNFSIKRHLFIMAALIALCAGMPAFAMRLVPMTEYEIYQAEQQARKSKRSDPDKLYLPIKLDQPITDELLEKLAPAWIENKDFLHQNAKNQLLQDVLNRTNEPQDTNWPSRRKEIIRATYFGADPELIGPHGETCLHGATLFNDYQLANYLLSKGANPNAKDNENRTPISACKTVPLARLLLAHGACVSQALLYDCCGLLYASDLMQLYLDKGIVKRLELDGYIMLNRVDGSYLKNQLRKIAMLIRAGIDVNAKSPKGTTALHHAAYVCNVKFAKLLLIAKADVNTQDHTGQTALMNACIAKSEPLCTLMIEKGANVWAVDRKGKTAIHIAAALKNEGLCKILLNHQMHINAEIKATLHCLWRLRKFSPLLYNETYRNFEVQLLPHFRPYASLSKLLGQRNYENQRPFDYLPIEYLNPEKYVPTKLKEAI